MQKQKKVKKKLYGSTLNTVYLQKQTYGKSFLK